MTSESAEVFKTTCVSGLILDQVRDLTTEIAKVLATSSASGIYFTLRKLTPEAARELARFPGSLWLSCMFEMSDETAEALSFHKGKYLGLPNLNRFSAKAAQLLARHEGSVLLDDAPLRLFVVFASARKNAGRRDGPLLLNFHTASESTPDVAQALSSLATPEVGSRWTLNLTPEFARSLATLNTQRLCLTLKSLTPEAARELARFQGSIRLNFLEDLAGETAEALSTHKGGSLEIPHLKTLSEKSVLALARHEGSVYAPYVDYRLRPAFKPAHITTTAV
jgi:hypothetical protein